MTPTRLRCPGLAKGGLVLALALLAAPAMAHFLWIGVDPAAEAPVRLSFGETPDERTEAVPVERLGGAAARDAAGAPLVLASGDGAWTGGRAGSSAATAAQSWGIVDRSGDGTGAFLLEYYAKGAASLEEAATDLGQPLEIVARRQGTRAEGRVRWASEAVGLAPLHVHLPSGKSFELVTDEAGRFGFDLVEAGQYGVRARKVEARSGELDGKAYGEVRHYATLTFGVPASQPLAVATDPSPAAAASAPAEADPAAYALLKGAHDSRQVMPADFPGFRCDLVFQQDDQVFTGRLTYRRQGETEVEVDGADEAARKWLRDQLLNLVGHRRGGDFAKGDGKYPLQLGPADDNAYGRLILVNDDMQSSYRVRDNRVLEVTRVADGSRFTISVIETMDADDGKYLANHFVVSYRDAETGALQKFEGYRDSYAHVEDVWLPTSRTVLEVRDDATSPTVRTIRLRKPVMLAPEETPGG